MKKSSLISIGAVVAASALLLTGCSASGGGASASRACVILPDTESSPRWESNDRPALETALTDAGYEADIQNAGGDTAKYATIAPSLVLTTTSRSTTRALEPSRVSASLTA